MASFRKRMLQPVRTTTLVQEEEDLYAQISAIAGRTASAATVASTATTSFMTTAGFATTAGSAATAATAAIVASAPVAATAATAASAAVSRPIKRRTARTERQGWTLSMIEHLHKLYQAGNTLAEVQTHLRGRGLDSIKAKRYATLRVCNTTPKEHIKATASALKKYVEDQTTVDPALVAELTRVATGTVQGQKQRETIQGFTNAEIRAIFYKVVPKNRNGKRVQMVTPVSLRQAARNSRVNRASACGPHISVYAVNQPAFPSASEVASTVVFKHPLLRRRASV